MSNSRHIHYLQRNEINKEAWNDCVAAAANGLIYAHTFYLDALCTQWDAFVWGNYRAIMPLPWRKKWGIKYVYPPAFIQQLGWFGNDFPKELISEMKPLLRKNFSFGEYFFNYTQQAGIPKDNYLLDLHKPYEKIAAAYKTDLRKNLKRAGKHILHYRASNNFQKAIDYYQNAYEKRMPHVTRQDYKNLSNLFGQLAASGNLMVREVHNAEDETYAIAACPVYRNRIYFLLSTTTPAGRQYQANHFLVDELIKEFSLQEMVLDFEGSDIESIAHFYKNFGAINQPYFFYRWNYLPWPIKLLKK